MAGRRRVNTHSGRKRHKKYRRNNNTVYFAMGGVIFALLIVGIIIWVGNGSMATVAENVDDIVSDVANEPKIADGIMVEGVAVGGMTKEEAATRLSGINTRLEGNIVNVKSSDGKYSYSYTYGDFDAKYDIPGAIEDAFLENADKDISAFSFDEEKITEKIRQLGTEVDIKPVNAEAKRSGGAFVVTTPAANGQEVDEASVVHDIVELLNDRKLGQDVIFELEVKEPSVMEADFNSINTVIGEFQSPYKKGDDNRIGNLKNACYKLDGVVVAPGEVFSTNDSFNPCTIENGWFMAGTIVNGKVEDSIGGGMCQVSSALYDAVLYAELEVVERFNHSLKVGYSDYAFDATLAGDYKDLKFKNNTEYPVYIESYLGNNNVVVNLYGYEVHSSSRTLKFENKFVAETEPEEPIVTYDDTMEEGTEKVTVKPLAGQKYELYKYVYEGGQLVDTVKINTSTYLPRRGEVTKGSKKPEATTEVSGESASQAVPESVSVAEAE